MSFSLFTNVLNVFLQPYGTAEKLTMVAIAFIVNLLLLNHNKYGIVEQFKTLSESFCHIYFVILSYLLIFVYAFGRNFGNHSTFYCELIKGLIGS